MTRIIRQNSVIKTAKQVLTLAKRELKKLQTKHAKARAAWLKAMHTAEAKASVLNGIVNALKLAEEKVEDYQKEVNYYTAGGAKTAARATKRTSAEKVGTKVFERAKTAKKASKKTRKKAS